MLQWKRSIAYQVVGVGTSKIECLTAVRTAIVSLYNETSPAALNEVFDEPTGPG